MQSDSEIVEAVLDGNQAAYADLVRRHEGAVKAVAVQILGDLHAAEDAAQDAFVKAYESLGGLRNGTAFRPWLLQIARRRAIDIARRQADTVPLDGRTQSTSATPDDRVSLKEEAKLLLDAVMKLPDHEREAILLRHFDGHTVRGVADAVGRSVGTVTKQLTRARARLRDMLKDHRP